MSPGWLSGRAAEQMERLSEAEVGQGCTEVLKSVLKNPNVPLPNKVVRYLLLLNVEKII